MNPYAHIHDLTAAALKVFLAAQLSAAPALGTGLEWFKIMAALFSVFCAVVIVISVAKKNAAEQGSGSAAVAPDTVSTAGAVAPQTGAFRNRWNEILSHLDSPQEAEWKVAVIEADKLVELALAGAGFAGGSFGDRLTNIAPGTLVSLDGIWWAHKVRNRLAHELDYFLRYTEARQAIGYYEQALTELSAI